MSVQQDITRVVRARKFNMTSAHFFVYALIIFARKFCKILACTMLDITLPQTPLSSLGRVRRDNLGSIFDVSHVIEVYILMRMRNLYLNIHFRMPPIVNKTCWYAEFTVVISSAALFRWQRYYSPFLYR